MPTSHKRQSPGGQAAETPAPPVEDAQWQAEFFVRKRLERARIPRRFAGKSLENFNTKNNKIRRELVRFAQDYINAFSFKMEYPQGLLMIGQVGCGKSHLAVSILRGVIAKGFSGLYYNSPDLLRDIRATFDRESDVTEDDLLEEVTTTDLLVFDDLGAENSTNFVLDRFYLIINERYEGCKPVIVTTNLELEALEERLGKRLVSRLLEMCSRVDQFPDQDWRREKMR